MSQAPELPVPFTDDVDSGAFWAAAAQGKVTILRCDSCHAVLHLPKAYCHHCSGWQTSWHEVSPRGRLYTWTTTYRELRPGFTPPYTVVVVELDDAPKARYVGYLPGEPELTVGMPMTARFEQRADATLVNWVPA
jgi:uncharacterized OB-fold protein